MGVLIVVLKGVLLAAAVAALVVLASNWPSRLDLHVAMRYLRSRRSSRLLSLITVAPSPTVTLPTCVVVPP